MGQKRFCLEHFQEKALCQRTYLQGVLAGTNDGSHVCTETARVISETIDTLRDDFWAIVGAADERYVHEDGSPQLRKSEFDDVGKNFRQIVHALRTGSRAAKRIKKPLPHLIRPVFFSGLNHDVFEDSGLLIYAEPRGRALAKLIQLEPGPTFIDEVMKIHVDYRNRVSGIGEDYFFSLFPEADRGEGILASRLMVDLTRLESPAWDFDRLDKETYKWKTFLLTLEMGMNKFGDNYGGALCSLKLEDIDDNAGSYTSDLRGLRKASGRLRISNQVLDNMVKWRFENKAFLEEILSALDFLDPVDMYEHFFWSKMVVGDIKAIEEVPFADQAGQKAVERMLRKMFFGKR